MVSIREMTIDDYADVIHLMETTEGISVREADSYEATRSYLERNPGLSFIAEADEDNSIIGCVMCGHDGRRGYLQHLIVVPSKRKMGVASILVKKCIDSLAQLRIYKTHIDVLITNELAVKYWKKSGWKIRDDIIRFSFVNSENKNA
jgi:N-acetylglutamate synthase